MVFNITNCNQPDFDQELRNILENAFMYYKRCNITKEEMESYYLMFGLYHTITYKIIASIIFASIGIIGLVGNLMVIFVVIWFKRMHTPTNFYLSSLAAADCLVLMTTIPFEIISCFSRNEWLFGDIFCRFTIYIQFMAINCSSVNIFFFTIERYKAICDPLKKYKNAYESKKVIFIIWAGCLVYNLSWFFTTKTKEEERFRKFEKCTYNYERNIYLILYCVDFIIFYILVLITTGFMYFRIIGKLKKRYDPVKKKINHHKQKQLTNHQIESNNCSTIASRSLNEQNDDNCFELETDRNSSIIDEFNDCLNNNRNSTKNSFGQDNFSLLSHKSVNHSFTSSNRNSIKKTNSNKSTTFDSSIKFNRFNKFNKFKFNHTTQLEIGDEINRINFTEQNQKKNFKLINTAINFKKDSAALNSKKERELRKIVIMLILIVVLFGTLLAPYRFLLVYNSLAEGICTSINLNKVSNLKSIN